MLNIREIYDSFNFAEFLDGDQNHANEIFQDMVTPPENLLALNSWLTDPLEYDDEDLKKARLEPNFGFAQEIAVDSNGQQVEDVGFGETSTRGFHLLVTKSFKGGDLRNIIQAKRELKNGTITRARALHISKRFVNSLDLLNQHIANTLEMAVWSGLLFGEQRIPTNPANYPNAGSYNTIDTGVKVLDPLVGGLKWDQLTTSQPLQDLHNIRLTYADKNIPIRRINVYMNTITESNMAQSESWKIKMSEAQNARREQTQEVILGGTIFNFITWDGAYKTKGADVLKEGGKFIPDGYVIFEADPDVSFKKIERYDTPSMLADTRHGINVINTEEYFYGQYLKINDLGLNTNRPGIEFALDANHIIDFEGNQYFKSLKVY